MLGTCLIILVLSYLMVCLITLPLLFSSSQVLVQGIYLLSTVVQLRSSFPPPLAQRDISADDANVAVMPDASTNLFNLIPPWELFSSLFDLTFLVAALVTAGVKWSLDRLRMVE